MTYLTVPFFTYIYAVLPVWIPLAIVDAVAMYILLFREKFDPRTFVFWVAIVFILPFLGFVMYLLWGCTLFIDHDGRRKTEADAPLLAGTSDAPAEERALANLLDASGSDICTSGNRASLDWDVADGIDGLVDDIGSAESFIHIETYRLYDDERGRRIADALKSKAVQGVDVRLITTRYGLGRTPGLREMRRAGVRHATFHSRINAALSLGTKNRGLRQCLTIDGRVAYMISGSLLRIEGPSADRAERRFLADWSYAAGERVEAPASAPAACGGDRVQLVPSGPDAPQRPLLNGYSAVISESRESLYITLPYLIPTDEMYNAIKQAVITGVDVRILIPRRGRHWYQAWNSLSAANPLMMAGASVYFADKTAVRCAVVADGRRCILGTGVFNSRSVRADYGLNAVVCSEDVARVAEAGFLAEFDEAAMCRPEEYSRRSLGDRLKIAVARMLMFFNRCGITARSRARPLRGQRPPSPLSPRPPGRGDPPSRSCSDRAPGSRIRTCSPRWPASDPRLSHRA